MAQSHVAGLWQEVARAAFFEDLYRGRNVLWLGTHDARLVETLLGRGAARVTLLAAGDQQAALRKRYAAAPVRVLSRLAMPSAGAARGDEDVAFVSHGAELFRSLEAEAAGRISYVLRRAILAALSPDGWLIAAAHNGDAAVGDAVGVKFYDFVDLLGRDFRAVTMVGQGALAGVTLAPFGQEEAEPRLDTALAGETGAGTYVAIAGPKRLPLPYGLIALPPDALVAAVESPSTSEAKPARAETRVVAATPVPAVVAASAPAGDTPLVAELRERAKRAERVVEEARTAALAHVQEMQRATAVIGERDAYIVELERANRAVESVRDEARAAVARADEIEARERAARRRVAELEGTVLRLEHGGARVPDVAPPSLPEPVAQSPVVPVAPDAEARIAELTARLADAEERAQKLQARTDEAQREAWAHMRARSEAEAAAAEVREDTVRKLKDARKIANVELMRAMEEAMRKATLLKEELTRTERERKDAVAALAEARAQAESLRAGVDEEVRARASAEVARALEQLERRVVEAEAQRAAPPDHSVDAARPDLLARFADAVAHETAQLGALEDGLRRLAQALRAGDDGVAAADAGSDVNAG